MKNRTFSLRHAMSFFTLLLVVLITLFVPFQKMFSQVEASSELFRSLKKMDSLIFDEGFNKCQIESMERHLHTDFEFYHDENGVQDKALFLKGFRESICSSPDRKPIRKLVEGSLTVFRLKNNGETYGAIQKGEHLFYIKEANKDMYLTNIAKFTSLWLIENGAWKLKRALSYDHHEPSKYVLPAALDKKFNAHFLTPLFDKEKAINRLLKQHKIPSLSIGYIDHGQLQQIRAFGNQKETVPVSMHTLYKVASLTKPITALVTLKLVNDNKWDLDTPIYHYYIDEDLKDSPELKKMTTRHILSHQSGLPNWRYLTASKQLAFEFEPGTRYQYSGEGFEYLRKALEDNFKKPLEALAKELIFEPLGMTDTHFYWSENVDESHYALEHDAFENPLPIIKNTEANAAANVITTVKDYATFMTYVLNGAGLSKDLYSQMISKQVSVKKDVDFGLGWEIYNNLGGNEYALQHGGKDEGLNMLAVLLPNSKRGLLIFVNSENGLVLWKKIIEEYLGDVGKELVYKNLN